MNIHVWSHIQYSINGSHDPKHAFPPLKSFKTFLFRIWRQNVLGLFIFLIPKIFIFFICFAFQFCLVYLMKVIPEICTLNLHSLWNRLEICTLNLHSLWNRLEICTLNLHSLWNRLEICTLNLHLLWNRLEICTLNLHSLWNRLEICTLNLHSLWNRLEICTLNLHSLWNRLEKKPVSKAYSNKFYINDKVRILCLSCNIKKSKTTAKLCHLWRQHLYCFCSSTWIRYQKCFNRSMI